MSMPIPSHNETVKMLLDQVAQGEVKGLKQLSPGEIKVLKNALESLASGDSTHIQIDKSVIKKLSQPDNYKKNPIRSLVKGVVKKFFKSETEVNSLTKFINENASAIRQNLGQIGKAQAGSANNLLPSSSLPPKQEATNNVAIDSNKPTDPEVESLRQEITKMKKMDFPLFLYEGIAEKNPSTIVKLFDQHGPEMKGQFERLGTGDVAKKAFIDELHGLKLSQDQVNHIAKILMPESFAFVSKDPDVEALREQIAKMPIHDFPLFIDEGIAEKDPSTIVKLFDQHGPEMKEHLERLGGDKAKTAFINELNWLKFPENQVKNIAKLLEAK